MKITVPFHVLAMLLACSSAADAFAFTSSPLASGSHTAVNANNNMMATISERVPTCAFVPSRTNSRSSSASLSSTTLFAKKKAKKTPAAAALEQLAKLEAQELSDPIAGGGATAVADPFAADVDEPLSKKEQMALEKKRKKEAKAAKKAAEQAKNDAAAGAQKAQRAAALAALENGEEIPDPFAVSNGAVGAGTASSGLSKKEQMAMEKKAKKEQKKAEKAARMVALEEGDNNAGAPEYDEFAPPQKEVDILADIDTSGMSKKEIKKLRLQEQKKRDKMAAKAAKKAARKAEMEAAAVAGDDEDIVPGGVPGEGLESSDSDGNAAVEDIDAPLVSAPDSVKKEKVSLEEKIRKERPPPRIRVMESSQPNYSALRLENVGVTFRDQEVIKDVTWGVQTGDRIGLVGANGAGKTTQLRILAGELEPTTGDVVKSSKDLRVAMLRQEFVDELVPTRTLKEEFMSVFEEENAILEDLRAVESELENLGADTDADKMQEVLDRMQKLQAKADAKDVYALESRAKKVMDLMGFTTDEGMDKVSMFSGGWKMRIGLGKVLLKDPNILLLDEPTNHLDLESVEWLEEFLRNQNIPMIIVSHDREFLDQVCTKIVDAEGGICTEYDGNYSRFLQLKKARMESWQAAYDAQEKKVKEERKWIQKFKLKQPQAVKQRQAQLEKLTKSKDYVQKPPFFGKPFRFRFPDAPRLSPEVAEVKHLSHSYGNGETLNKLFENSDLFIEKNDRIAVLGPNGSGKSTLLRIMMGKEEPDEGRAEIVGQNVVPAYFEQNQADALDLDKTVIETVQAASNGQSYNELRALLGQFLFKGDAVEKKVESLSGGEKARLSLCCMMLTPANLLILDEPTNHLDIPAKQMLEEALQHFQGSVVVISHDRYFISKVATTIVAIEDKNLVKYSGDYKLYMDKSKHVKEKVEKRYVKGVDRIGAAPVIDLEEIEIGKKKKNFGGAKNANMVTRKDKGVKNAKRQK